MRAYSSRQSRGRSQQVTISHRIIEPDAGLVSSRVPQRLEGGVGQLLGGASRCCLLRGLPAVALPAEHLAVLVYGLAAIRLQRDLGVSKSYRDSYFHTSADTAHKPKPQRAAPMFFDTS